MVSMGPDMARSDAPYPSPLFVTRETVMSVDTQANHSQNYNNPGANRSSPHYNQSDFLYQNRACTAQSKQETNRERAAQAGPGYYYPNTNTNFKEPDRLNNGPSLNDNRQTESDRARIHDQIRERSPEPQIRNGQTKFVSDQPEYGSPQSSDKENKDTLSESPVSSPTVDHSKHEYPPISEHNEPLEDRPEARQPEKDFKLPPGEKPLPPRDSHSPAYGNRLIQEYPTKQSYEKRPLGKFPFDYPSPELSPSESGQNITNASLPYTSPSNSSNESRSYPEHSPRYEHTKDSVKQENTDFKPPKQDYPSEAVRYKKCEEQTPSSQSPREEQEYYRSPPQVPSAQDYYRAAFLQRGDKLPQYPSDTESSEAADLSHPSRLSSLSPGGGSLPPTPNKVPGLPGLPGLPGPLGHLAQAFPHFLPQDPHNGDRDLFYCHLCSYVGTSKYHFNAHMNSHFEHQCPQCDYTSRTEGRLKRHIKDFHSEKPPENFSGQAKTMRREPGRPKVFKCRQCEYSTPTKTDFWEHARSHIKEDKVLNCPKCPFVTEYKHHLEYHLRNHFGSKPFKCTKCNYSCVNKSMLNSHMKSHTNVYQYRCSDCTYATKYCHSLKLHLRKYNHKPATVLNTDGSLPTDGSGDFELVSKRGPPRGPRGPRKDKDSDEAGYSPPAVNMMIPSPAFPNQNLNGSMLGGFPWMLGGSPNGLQPPPPLIPVSGMPPLSIQVPPSQATPQVPPPQDAANISRNLAAQEIAPQASREREVSPAQSPAESQLPRLKCTFCEFFSESRAALTQHMLKVHAAENQDLFSMFGIQTESMMMGGMEEAAKLLEYRKQLAEAQMKELLARTPIKIEPTSPEKEGSFPPPGLAHLWAAGMLGSRPSPNGMKAPDSVERNPSPNSSTYSNQSSYNSGRREKYNDILAQDLAATIEAEARQNGECPLDLTKPNPQGSASYPEADDSYLSQGEQNMAMDLSPVVGHKRRLEQMEEDVMRARTNSFISTGSSSPGPTPRKRSRKGKAYKLDALCMKLQERREGSPATAGYNSHEEDFSDYTSDKPASIESAPTPNSTGQQEEKTHSDVDYSAIHNSLSQLNSGTAEQKDSETDDSAGPDVARNLEAEFSKNGNTRPSIEKSLPLPARANGGYECQHCGISFRDCILYTMHMGYHGYKDPFKCNMCGHTAANKVEFFLHIARVAHQ